MRITLDQWAEYGLPVDAGNGTEEDAAADCSACRTFTYPGESIIRVDTCVFHSGFVDGFDAARGGG